MYIGDTNIEVTQKELIIAIIFALISIGIGFYVGNRMGIWQDEHNAKYNQAVKIDNDSTQFAYAFKTDAGHTLSYGTAEAIGSVTDNNIPGQYMSIHRVLEVYTMHTRLVCTGSGKTRSCHTQVYWTWDYKGADDWATTQELHELMGGSTYVDSKGETFYQPINVGGKNGITKDAVKIVTWTDNEGTRLTNEELAAFNDVTLLVAKKFGATATALTNVDDFTEVNPQNPALLTVPSETPWMKELTRIDKGYPNFFGSGWYEESNSEYLYK